MLKHRTGTVQKQYTSGPLRIAQWALIVNAHIFPGPDIIRALKSAALEVEPPFSPATTIQIAADIDNANLTNDDPEPSAPEGRRPSIQILSTTTIDTRVEPMPADPHASALSSTAKDQRISLTEGTYPSHKGLLLLAEMSSKGNLLTGGYTSQCVSLAREHRDFVLGFIAQRSLNSEEDDNFLTMTPGVFLPPPSTAAVASPEPNKPQDAGAGTGEGKEGDGLGQQYTSPRQVVLEQGSDVVIVGRGILTAKNKKAEAERYRREAWRAYELRLARYRA